MTAPRFPRSAGCRDPQIRQYTSVMRRPGYVVPINGQIQRAAFGRSRQPCDLAGNADYRSGCSRCGRRRSCCGSSSSGCRGSRRSGRSSCRRSVAVAVAVGVAVGSSRGRGSRSSRGGSRRRGGSSVGVAVGAGTTVNLRAALGPQPAPLQASTRTTHSP